MTYLFLYVIGLVLIWYIYKVGWLETLKTSISVITPSILIILFNLKAGRLLFKSPVLGIISILPTSIVIFRGSRPLVSFFLKYIDNKFSNSDSIDDAIDTESTPVDDE